MNIDFLIEKSVAKGEIRVISRISPEQLETLDPAARFWAKENRFSAKTAEVLLVPGANGSVQSAILGCGDDDKPSPLCAGALAKALPPGAWRFDEEREDENDWALGFALGHYRFTRYREEKGERAALAVGASVDLAALKAIVKGVYLARDLINTPANDMGPGGLEQAVRGLAGRHGAEISAIAGEALLAANLPMIHAVGRAAAEEPRLVDMAWGAEDAPRVTLVGKGVCFDTGGLDIKSASSMLLMKKDMGGAANVLGLASMIMEQGLKLRLRVLIPIVENAISANAFRPGDILTSRKGLTVEIGNTDAEGRLVLADAMALADEDRPDILIDMATLTGAARVALGPELAPFYTNDERLADDLHRASSAVHDPVWRMPLWSNYASGLSSKIADTNNITGDGFAGSITAALFLSKFVEDAASWMHFDIFGWVPTAKPHAPVGGEAQGIRALFEVLKNRYPAG